MNRFLFISLLFCAVAPARCLSQQIAPDPAIPDGLGVNIHFTSPEPGEMAELAACGVRWVRMDFLWSDTERAKGQYDFSAYDRFLAALAPWHIRPILILDYGNKLYDHGLAPYTASGRVAFASWVAAAVKHFHGRGIIWEMWNEPNGSFWKPKVNFQNYIWLAFTVGETIRETEPGETYIGPASAIIDFPFLTACFRAGLLSYWDGVSVHPYRQRDPETVIPVYVRLRALIAQYAPKGKTVPIISGEWGYPSVPIWWGMNEEGQARMLAREWLTNTLSGVPLSIWYDWRDDGDDPKIPDDYFGLVQTTYRAGGDPAFAPKPAYRAAETLTHALDGYAFKERLEAGGPADYVLLFVGRGEERLAAWTTSSTPHRILIPGARGRFRAIGLEGRPEPALRAHHGGLAVTLTGAPQYLIPRKRGQLRLSDF
jgi:polysaccharide biosynthesis protein PslG